ncbi:MAG: amino acid adenylation domain-containing protein [Proteobacteria bacterium]|nr:amino acid adenylation domain-containing protein [Pseudomonadota bacterium]
MNREPVDMLSESSFFAPLSFSQERLYFFDRLSPGSALYAVSYRLQFDGELDVPALEWALRGLVGRHEVLRSRFVERDGAFCQQVLPPGDWPLPIEDLSDRTDASAAVDAIALAFGSAPYDLEHGPVMRARVLKLQARRHVLLLGLHHIVFDGPSSAVMARDLDELYGAAREARAPRLPELPIQYADYAQWQRERYDAGELDADLAYWKAALAGAPALLALPTDHPRPAARSYIGRTLEARLPRSVRAGVVGLSERLGVTPFIVFSTVLNLLLARFSGQADVCLGFPVAGRDHPDLEDLIGFFSNTLVLRPRLRHDASVCDAVERTRDCVVEALAHQEMPFDKLVEALAPERSLGWHPLFQVCVVYQTDEDHWRLGTAEARFTPTDVGISKFDLTFYFEDRGDDCTLRIEYSTELFEARTVAGLRRGFEQLCAAACRDPQRRLDELDLLSPDARMWLQTVSRGSRPPLPPEGLASRFEAQVRRTPSRIALRSDRIELTYAQLDAQATRLAQRLRDAGIQTEDRVAIVSARGPQMLVAVLGVLKADAAYVPLDPAYPPERLRFMVEDSGAALVIGDGLAAMPAWDRPTLDIAAVLAAPHAGNAPLPRRFEHPDQLAYVMYTSGSTGRPKGAGISHRAVARLVTGARFLPFEEGLTFAQLSSFSFDASTLEFWGALLHGGTLALFDDMMQLEPERFRDFLARHRVTTLFVTVALLTRLIEARPDAFAGVRHLMYGGDRADAATLARLRASGFDGELINGYGPTETTTFACTHPARAADIAANDIPIGQPIANTEVYVLGPSMELLPAGATGELYIGGAGVARGYDGRPALTAERFVPHPYADTPGARLYRTGDRCLWNVDGTIRYLGRVDEQVKIDGFRIEPEEVRLAMLRFPGVRQAAVHVQQLDGAGKRLVAYVVADGGALQGSDVKAYLRGLLPSFMVPAQVHAMPDLPLTANGKIDYRALERRTSALPAPAVAAPMRTALADRFFAIVSELLGVPAAREEDRYFDIGGTSLAALRLTARVAAELGRHLPLTAVFQSAQLGDIAATLESLPRRAHGNPSRRPPDERTDAPLSFSQERLYFFDRLSPGSALYAVPYRFELAGELDVPALERAFQQLIQRHEALRTRFIERDGAFLQQVLPSIGFELPLDDLSGRDDAAASVDAIAREFGAAPYALGAGPLIRARVLRLAPQQHVLLLGLHHIVFDGPSSTVMARELDELYSAAREHRAPRLPALPIQYADYAQWQRTRQQASGLDEDLAYWKAALAGAPTLLELPTDRPRPASRTYSGSSLGIEVPPALRDGLVALSHAMGVTPFVVFSAVLDVLLARCSGQTDICLGFPVAGRGHPDLEGLIGFFSNTLVLRPKLPPECSFREAITRTRDCVLGALEHAEMPFDKLVDALAPERSLGWHPLFQVCVVYQTGEDHWRLGPLQARYTPTDVGISKFDITFTLEQRADGMSLMAEYSDQLFAPGTVQSMLAALSALLQACVDDPDADARRAGGHARGATTGASLRRRR